MAEGYLELGMLDDAQRVFEELGALERRHPQVQMLLLQLLIRRQSWDEAILLGRTLIAGEAGVDEAYLHTAYCMHETGRTREARELLLEAPQSMHGDALFHYNLACYEAVLGASERALYHLDKSIALNPAFKQQAMVDPDLKSLRSRAG